MMRLEYNHARGTSIINTGLMLGALGLSLVCYGVACVLPIYATGCFSNDWVRGIDALLLGWMAIVLGQFAWLANLPLFAAWAVLLWAALRPMPANSLLLLILAIVGLGFALTFYLNQDFIWCGSTAPGIPKVVQHGAGLYVWFASFAAVLGAGFWALLRSAWVASRGA
jgi:hypothetical protein